jgi:hypothetical protein
VAAGEDETKPVIDDIGWIDRCFGDHFELARTFTLCLSKPIDSLESPRGDEPRSRVRRRALDRPALHRRRERILQRLLGEIEIAEEANEGGKDATGFGAVDRLDQVCDWLNSMMGRTSMVPCCAPGIREATCTASLRSLALIM